LLLDGCGDRRGRATQLSPSLTISMLCRSGCLARQTFHFGLGVVGKGTDGMFRPIRKVCGMVVDNVVSH